MTDNKANTTSSKVPDWKIKQREERRREAQRQKEEIETINRLVIEYDEEGAKIIEDERNKQVDPAKKAK